LINLIDNKTTVESLKSIWTLLELDLEVVIYFDEVIEQEVETKA